MALRSCVAEPDGAGKIQNFLADSARRLKIWIVGGTVPKEYVPGVEKGLNASRATFKSFAFASASAGFLIVAVAVQPFVDTPFPVLAVCVAAAIAPASWITTPSDCFRIT